MFELRANNERVDAINIPVSLMLRNVEIAKANILISRHGFVNIETKTVLSRDLLPHAIAQKGGASLHTWFLKRGMSMKSRRNIHFAGLVLSYPERSEDIPLVLSLLVNAVSLIDKFWLNPAETTSFEFNGAHIVFERKCWAQVDPFQNLYYPGEIDQCGLYDIVYFVPRTPMLAKSLIWSTQGWTNRRWIVKDGGYILEKQLRKKSIDNEITTFEFFASRGILVPKYSLLFEEYDNEKHRKYYNPGISDEGLYIIRKQCLTDSNSRLERLYEYIQDSDNIESAIRRMCAIYNVSNDTTEQFAKAIKEYQEKYYVADNEIENRNIGLLVSDKEAKPVVWGRLKMRWDPFFRVLEDV